MELIRPTKCIFVEELDGTIVKVNKLSIRKTEEFKHILRQINEEVNKEVYRGLTIDLGYVQQPVFAHLVDSILELCGLNADRLDPENLHFLLFPHEMPDGSYERQGVLGKHILGEVTGGATIDAPVVDNYAKLLGELWGSFSSLSEVMVAIENLDYDSLIEVIKHKNESLKPAEEKAKASAIANAKKAMEKMTTGVKIDKSKEIDINSLM